RAESHGKFYQWGINVAWNSMGSSASGAIPSGSWNTSTYPSNWNTHPCPDGYRLPTKDEFQTLINSSTAKSRRRMEFIRLWIYQVHLRL
ncbi:MAG: hypothetical protein K2F53_00735, partial [Rikenellaceae bacterium]|nr:hypothetical protein [Rikenellaceae bacterium]